MHTTPFIFSVLGATLITAGVMTAHAQEGFYDPSNVGSPTGKTIGHELSGTIGCPGRQLLDKPCEMPKEVVLKEAPKVAPKDSDGDGVVDDNDNCLGTPAGRKVNAVGCEIDSDGDGLVDGVDKCPTVYAKTADGCPAAPVPKKLELKGVNFEYDKAVLRQEDMPILNNAAVQLGEWGDVKVEVGGHTDDRGSDDYNQKLSQQRAEAVRDYLISKGIAADRLTAKGYGEAQPVADNASDEGRLQNRRVELVPQQ